MLRRIAISAPFTTPFYTRMLGAMCKAFAEIGVVAVPVFQWLNEEMVEPFIGAFEVDAIIEINRSRNQAPPFPASVRHVTWLQDSKVDNAITVDGNFGGSDIHYVIGDPKSIGLDINSVADCRYLAPGININDFPVIGIKPDHKYDLCFAGYIPRRDQIMGIQFSLFHIDLGNGQSLNLPLIEFFQVWFRKGLTATTFHRDDAIAIAREYLSQYYGLGEQILQNSYFTQRLIQVAHDYEKEWARWEERHWLVTTLSKVSGKLAIHGPPAGWNDFPETAPYFRGYLTTPAQMAGAFSKCRLMIHTGALQMHFRVLEAMACSLPVLVNRTSPGFGHNFGAIREHFEEGSEFVEYDRENLQDVAVGLLADPARCRAIGERARAAIIAKHLWRHRAQQILSDLQE